MRYFKYILVGLILISCNPFHADRILKNESDLIEIYRLMEEYDNVTLEVESDDRLADNMRKLDIDYVIKNSNKRNVRFSGFIEESDSLLIFVKKNSSIFSSEKRIIYDFARVPRNFRSDKIKGASYEIVQLNERWYFTTVGFD